MKPTLILDTKDMSPFGWESKLTWMAQFAFAENHADIIAVHSMPEFGGTDSRIQIAIAETKKKILVKGIHRTDDEIQKYLDMGADYVLVVGRLPDKKYWDKCMMEPTCIAEIKNWDLKGVKFEDVPMLVWNTRNLVTGLPKIEKFDEYYRTSIGWVCQASMIESIEDINPNADAIMVGTHMRKIVKELQDRDERT